MNTPHTPPGTVLGAQILLGVAFVAGFLQAVPAGPFSHGSAATSWSSFLTFVATGGASWAMGWTAQQGCSVLRIAFSAAITAFGTALAVTGLQLNPAHWVQLGMFAAASALLYAPSAQEWFVFRKAERTDPLAAQALWEVAHARRLSREQEPLGVSAFISLCILLAACAAAGAVLLTSK